MTEQQYDHHQFPAELLERQGEDLNITEGTIPALDLKCGGFTPSSRDRLFVVAFNFFFQTTSLHIQSSNDFCLSKFTEPPTKGIHF